MSLYVSSIFEKVKWFGLGDHEDCWQQCTVHFYFYDLLPAAGGLFETFPNIGSLFAS